MANIQGSLDLDGAKLTKAIAGIKALKLAELKAKREVDWQLDNKRRSAVSVTYRETGRAATFKIELDAMDVKGYADTITLGYGQYGNSMSKASSEQKVYEDVQRSAVQKLQSIITTGKLPRDVWG